MMNDLSFPEMKIREVKGIVFEVLSELAEKDNIKVALEDVEFVSDFLIHNNQWWPEEEEITDIWNNWINGIYYYVGNGYYELGRDAIEEGMDYPEGINEEDYEEVGKWIIKEYPENYMVTEYGIFVVGNF